MLELQNITKFLLKNILQIGQKKFLFLEKELQQTNQREFRTEKVLKRRSEKLYVKWKGYDISFNSWINKRDLLYK